MAGQNGGEILSVVAADPPIPRPEKWRSHDRPATRQPIVERTGSEVHRHVRMPVVARRSKPFREEAPLERVAIKVSVLPCAEPQKLFAKMRRGILIHVLHHRV